MCDVCNVCSVWTRRVFGACFEQQLPLDMTASFPTADRRPVPMVAIIGNDAVLAAAPATPVQLAHACLRRGFTVAVPASWGDELVAAEAVRRLASRERGPAVMCVCPFARSRLLAHGADLAPFLVSLVSPPVATARYLRAVYGDHAVHITYIGGCPSAEDASIDARLTPDAFLAELAEQGIALSEQPLVFDSIVPPDRRRWCSLPGGAPTADILWADSDTRTLIEIDREDVSTDLAQHIITHEHVLLDLAPGLGCVCSGAIGTVPSRSARGAVTALEPPRAPGPTIDPTPLVSLDVPVGEQTAVPMSEPSLAVSAPDDSMESRLDQMLGVPINRGGLELEIDVGVTLHTSGVRSEDIPARSADAAPQAAAEPREESVAPIPADEASVGADTPPAAASHAVPAPDGEVLAPMSAPENAANHAPAARERSPVRRRTPVPMPVRHPASTIPRATSSDGRALPRAYVAKRRTPSAGIVPVADDPAAVDATSGHPDSPHEAVPAAPASDVASMADAEAPASTAETATANEPQPPPPVENAATGAKREEPRSDARPETSEPPAMASPGPSDAPSSATGAQKTARPEPKPAGGAATATDTSPSAIVVLLVALIALGFFVLRSLN
jgi:hypothetical protein